MNIQEMLAERKRLLDEAAAIDTAATEEKRGLTEEEEATINGNLAAVKDLEAKIEAARDTEKRQAALRASVAAASEWDDAPQPQQTVLPGTRVPNVNIVGGEDSTVWGGFGEYCFKVRESGLNPAATDLRLKPLAAAPGVRGDVDSEGGFLIPDEYRGPLAQRVYKQGELLSRIKAAGMHFSLTGNTLKIPYVNETSRAAGSRWGGLRHYWVEETGTLTDSNTAFGQMTLTLKKLACLGYVTEEMIEDYSASEQFLMNAFASEIVYGVEDAIVNGNGSGKPVGLMTAACKIEVTVETNQTSTTLWGANVAKMYARCWAPARQNAVWLVNQTVEPQLWALTMEGRYGSASTAVDGIPMYHPAGSIMNSGTFGTLMGLPVLPVEYTQALGTAGDIILFDPASYALVDKSGGMKQASSIHVRFTTDERTFRITYRVDGQPTWASALTPDQGDTLSPIVTLGGR